MRKILNVAAAGGLAAWRRTSLAERIGPVSDPTGSATGRTRVEDTTTTVDEQADAIHGTDVGADRVAS